MVFLRGTPICKMFIVSPPPSKNLTFRVTFSKVTFLLRNPPCVRKISRESKGTKGLVTRETAIDSK